MAFNHNALIPNLLTIPCLKLTCVLLYTQKNGQFPETVLSKTHAYTNSLKINAWKVMKITG